MRSVQCNCCGADDTSPVLVGRDLLHGLAGEFTLVQCSRCGLIYMNPQLTPSELEAYYPEDYEAHVGTRRQRLGWLRRLDYNYGIEKRHRAIRRYAETGRLLDVGCGAGAFLEGMRERGWQVEGIEPGVRAATYAREELGLEIQNATLEEAHLELASLDVVTMWNVLEHLSDPVQSLNRIREALRPGGLLVCAIPNVDSYDLRLFQQYWAGYDLPRHLFVFPPETLQRMVQSAGFEVLDRRCIYGTYNAFAYSARFAMNDRLTSRRLRSILTRLLLSLPARALAMPACRIVDLLNRGTIMTWFCRRQGRP
jgi:2-polyprenyl-3-methyl-5-hydroxy-6-metoxy-1,4-benzoquinol methylase